MKPIKVLLFILLALGSLALASILLSKLEFKKSGETLVMLPDFTKEFTKKPDSTAYFAKLKKEKEATQLAKKKEEILKKVKKSTADTLELLEVVANASHAKFYFANDDHSLMDKFFESLEKVKNDNTSMRIIHYGDSQIEMDRISSYIREQLQRTYGGSGMGLLPALEVTPKYTVSIQSIGEWSRKLTFGTSEYKADHSKYGPMAYFCRKESKEASVVITARGGTSYKNKNFKSCKVIVGALDTTLTISAKISGKATQSVTLERSNKEQLVEFSADSSKGSIRINFVGAKADILGISLDGNSGVSVDNIPMRGCSGTVFRKINSENLRRSYKMLGVKVLILQFGGNALPGMKSPSSAVAYGERFGDQIKYLKSIDPELMIFVIGPADMSVRNNGNLETHEQLENVRDALKQATLDAGGIFWDMYEAMGGNGSMIKWVNSKPKLGSPDYIHFTQKGAVKISEIFYQTLMKEMEMYALRKKIQQDS
jgi:lysophospholipase L1-like esterase